MDNQELIYTVTACCFYLDKINVQNIGQEKLLYTSLVEICHFVIIIIMCSYTNKQYPATCALLQSFPY